MSVLQMRWLNRLICPMTRYTGGGEFVERREYPKYIEEIMENLEKLRAQYGYK
jgi:hypothetical protein